MTEEQYEMELEERRQCEKSEMEEYNLKRYEWECYMEQKKPVKPEVCDKCEQPQDHPEQMCACAFAMKTYERDLAEWHKEFHMDAPNKPGYYRANND